MPRMRWCPVTILCILFLWIDFVNAVCRYDNEKYEEGAEVTTREACLNCTCKMGTLICYLRVCPELPDPPPAGCIILHRYRTCCPELICTEIATGNRIEARSEPEDINDVLVPKSALRHACIANGTVYAPGSAMDSSSFCEYCYCLAGRQKCVKPRCLLPIEGCSPAYESHSCCPTHYNCTGMPVRSTSTTTSTPKTMDSGGCIVSGAYYTEGMKVIGVGHSACDNCYCLRGLVRCEPLSCAPPLLGCAPVIKPGECCAASYNCSGKIEIQAEPNYGHYPIVSKDYAKLRKEIQRKRPADKRHTSTESSNIPYYVMAESHETSKNVRSTFGTTRQFAGNAIFNLSTKSPYYYNPSTSVVLNSTNKQDKENTKGYSDFIIDFRTRPSTILNKGPTYPDVYYATTNYALQRTNYERPVASTTRPRSTKKPYTVNSIAVGNVIPQNHYQDNTTPKELRSSDYEDNIDDKAISTIVDSIDGRINRRVDVQNSTNSTEDYDSETTIEYSDTESTPAQLTVTTELSTQETTQYMLATTLNDTDLSTVSTNFELLTELITTEKSENTATINDDTDLNNTNDFINNLINPVTLRTVINTTDCNKASENNMKKINLEERHDLTALEEQITTTKEIKSNEIRNTDNDVEKTTELDQTTTTKDITEVDLESKLKVATVTLHSEIPPEIETLLNITHKNNKENDYEYDYNEPSLPPSLPNLRIIPFVAADALDTKKNVDATDNTVYPSPQERATESQIFSYTNLFSPPIKTEGGFIPKEPPLRNDYYEHRYHTSGVDITSATALPVPSFTNPPKTNENNCIIEGHERRHGETVPAEGSCVVCVCFYGSVVCQQPQCPPLKPGCRRTTTEDRSTCCTHIICDNPEAPTVVLDRKNESSHSQDVVTVAEGVATPDPFRDVIRTEPAPDLQSLIGDMMPYFVRQSTKNIQITTEKVKVEKPPKVNKNELEGHEAQDNEFSLDKVWQFLFSDETTKTVNNSVSGQEQITQTGQNKSHVETTTADIPSVAMLPSIPGSVNEDVTETRENISDDLLNNLNNVDSNLGVGLLKLAGCNIYGRMYRVGRIISELSTPCTECRCTEVGVQCQPLKC